MLSNNVEFYLVSVLLETEKIKRTPTPTMLCVLESGFPQRTTLRGGLRVDATLVHL